jgi:hypothetical protein
MENQNRARHGGKQENPCLFQKSNIWSCGRYPIILLAETSDSWQQKTASKHGILSAVSSKCVTKQLTDSLASWRKILPEKLIVTRRVKKFPVCCWTQRFISVFTRTRHSFLFRDESKNNTTPTLKVEVVCALLSARNLLPRNHKQTDLNYRLTWYSGPQNLLSEFHAGPYRFTI